MGFLAKNDKKSVKIQRAPTQNIIKTPYEPVLIGFSPILVQKTGSRPIIYKSTKKCPPLKLDVTSTKSGESHSIQRKGLHCQMDNPIFIIQCRKCKKQAIGWGDLSDYDPDSILKDHFYNHHPEISEPGKFISITFIDQYLSQSHDLSEEDRIGKLTEHQEFFEPEIMECEDRFGQKLSPLACNREYCKFCEKSIVESNPHSSVVTMVAQNTEEPEGTSGGKMMNFGPKARKNDEKR